LGDVGMKRAKIGKKVPTKVDNKEELRKLYKIPSYSVNNIYATILTHAKSTTVRLTFIETAQDLQESFPVCAVNMPIENLQQWYNIVGMVLQRCREDKRID
jgi:hypothetical protein